MKVMKGSINFSFLPLKVVKWMNKICVIASEMGSTSRGFKVT